MKKTVRIFIRIVLPILLAVILLLLFSLPYLSKNYINKHGKELIGRTVKVDEISVNYLTTTFNIVGFKLLEANDKDVFVSFDSLRINLDPIHLLGSKLVLSQFKLVKPEVTIVRRDSSYNFDDMILFFKEKSKGDSLKEPSKPLNYLLENISFERGKLTFDDQTVQHTTTMDDLGFTIPSVSYSQEEISNAGFQFQLGKEGIVQAKADFNQKRSSYTVDIKTENIDISPYIPYLKSYVLLKEMGGKLSGDFHLEGNVSNLDSVLFRGDARLVDFQAKDTNDQKVLGARQASVEMQNSYPMKFAFNFNSIVLTEPYLYFEMKDSSNNFIRLMADTTTSTEPFTYFYNINRLKIENGQIDFRDSRYEEPFDYHLSEVEMNVDSLSSVDEWVKAYASMKLNKRGKLKAELGINPSDPFQLDVKYVVTNFQLSDISSYTRHFVGYPFLLGNMYYESKTVIQARQLKSENKLIVRDAKLGKKSGGLMNIPLKLALYLLKDVHGDIILDLPVSGDLNDPKTKIGKLVWQVFKNFVVKVVASPFLALSHMVGVDPEEVKGLEFNYCDTTLTAGQLRRIRNFTEIEKKKPDMKIELTYFNDPELERKAVIEKLKAASGVVNPDSTGVNQLQKADSIRQIFEALRIKKVEQALHKEFDQTRITIVKPGNSAPENVGSRPVFELKYSIEE